MFVSISYTIQRLQPLLCFALTEQLYPGLPPSKSFQIKLGGKGLRKRGRWQSMRETEEGDKRGNREQRKREWCRDTRGERQSHTLLQAVQDDDDEYRLIDWCVQCRIQSRTRLWENLRGFCHCSWSNVKPRSLILPAVLPLSMQNRYSLFRIWPNRRKSSQHLLSLKQCTSLIPAHIVPTHAVNTHWADNNPSLLRV